ncbi:MAG: 50S ribosomal protein L7Ae [Candidatus Micrarchaeota archaeon]|nr:50S ribosomal protein L7Ae [Candidatus Micrarchaeota archaeon]
MAKSYVKFEVSNDVVSKTYEALQMVKQSGKVRKGANEVTKSVEQGLATFVVIAGDVEPEEVVVHIPKICEQKKVAYSYVPSKLELGKSIGLNVPCTAVAVENAGSAQHNISDIISKVTGVAPAASEKKEGKPAAAAPKPRPAKAAPAPKPQKPEGEPEKKE